MKKPIITDYHIPAPGRFLSCPLRILHLSDLHNTFYGRNQEQLIRKVWGILPDLVVITGDMFDAQRSHEAALRFLRGIKNIAPVYYVTGNHEYDAGVAIRLRGWLKKQGITLLEDRWVTIEMHGERILLAGLRDPFYRMIDPDYNQTVEMRKRFSSLWNEEGYPILIAHRPERISRYLEYPFDLILTGHAHGGQVRIPFTGRGLYAHNQGLFPSYSCGVYRFGTRRMVVNCGLSRFAMLPRVLNPPEMVLLTVGGPPVGQ